MSITEQLNRGFNFHKKGNFPQAEEAYRKVLTDDTKNIPALHLLGVVMIQTKRLKGGLELIDKALALKPDYAEALNNRGNALKELKRLDEAFEALQAICDLDLTELQAIVPLRLRPRLTRATSALRAVIPNAPRKGLRAD